uniref:PHD-type domain-containing protein n=1 Tax=Davidia involucrata TaxID=16924 RepID=A0A5B7BL46_DAVIN
MKRELAFALEAQSRLNGSLGRTRASKVQNIESNGVSEGRSSKRLKGIAANEPESIDRSRVKLKTSQKKVRVSHCNGISVYKRNKSVVETVIEDESKCNLATPAREDESKGELAEALVKEESNEGIEKPTVNEAGSEGLPIVVDESNEVKNDVPVEAPRRFTRSALKPKVEPVEGSVSVTELLEAGENIAVLKVEGNETGAVSTLGTPTKNLELKMSKKIALMNKPMTVKELFETGLLEGCSVFYNGGNKGHALRGTIKGIGILCSCTLCKGSRVVMPCQFEIHACKSYRRAAQYICLENGKSLLQVMKACEKSPVDTLEETIRSVIGSLPIRESMICQNCKGSFPATFAAKVGQLCELCMDSKNSQTSPTDTTGTNARSKPVLILKKSSRIAKMGISSENKSQEKKTKKWSTKLALVPKSSGSPSVRISSQNKCHGKTTKNSPRSILVPKSLGSASVHISSQNKSQGKIIKRSLRLALDPKSSGSASVHISSPKTSQGKITKKSSKLALIPRFSKSASLSSSPQNKSRWKITKKDLGFHKLVFEEDGLPDGSEVAYYSRGKKLLEGYKKGLGIFCRCCQSEISPSQFEAHAGWASRKKPYGNIYTSNGVSLHELAVSLLKGRKHPAKDNDDLCIICADGGNLLLCDGCPRAFHIECASLTSVPRGKWYCKYCQNMFQRDKFVEHNANAVAAGRVSGVDPIEQITKRCIRIVKNPEEAEVIACVLCRGYDFSKSGFGPRTVILCDQCEKEYHVGCLKKHKMADLKELPKGKWFCCMDCSRIYSALQNLLFRGEEKLPDFLLDVIKKKHVDKGLDGVTDFDVRWRLLSGKIASSETRLLLSRAVAIFHDCFDPIVDSATGRDFIPSMVYGRNIRGQDFGGMYCAVLTVNSSVVSAGILRVFGREVAELPLVATSNGNQGKGYFQLLFSCIEKLLAFLNVRSLVLPAADEAESIWTDKFGFEKMPQDQLRNYRRTCWQIVTFKGTSMLQKVVPKCRIINQDVAGFDVPMGSS